MLFDYLKIRFTFSLQMTVTELYQRSHIISKSVTLHNVAYKWPIQCKHVYTTMIFNPSNFDGLPCTL